MTRQERAVRTREALIEAAARLFDQDGYEVTSLAAVTALAGVSAGALYFHFATKADLADAVVEAAMARLRSILGPGDGAGGGGGSTTAGGRDRGGSGVGREGDAANGSAPGAVAGGGEAGPESVREVQRLIDTTHRFVRTLSADVVLRAGFGLDRTRGERTTRGHAPVAGAEGPAGRTVPERSAPDRRAAERAGSAPRSGAWPGVGGGLREVWSGWVHAVLAAADARGALAPGVAARDVAPAVVAATVGFEVLGTQDASWLAQGPVSGFWRLVLPALVPAALLGSLSAAGTGAAR
ncbi:TetR family transcriptional regulator [Streptomyces sp. NPDC048566]|uniref:TetR family transcriptional regulator n=1 Tax=Streptomyces sp. NPDC048566 TaxID=3365569 RepID=UPI00371FB2D3